MSEHSQQRGQPFVPASVDMPELTVKAVLLGVIMAIVLGAANAYVGMTAGLTVAAAFPAAVVAMAVLKPLGGTILEENMARTVASVGEALVAGAIFTLPAFVLSGAWENLRYLESTIIMFIGGLLGIFFVIVLRRTLVVESDLPFPESVAAAEIVKAGQGGQSGAKYVVGALGISAFWELLKNTEGIAIIRDRVQGVIEFGGSSINVLQDRVEYTGSLMLTSPALSPMLMGVGWIVGLKVSAILFSGAVMGWLFLVPLAVFLNPSLSASMGADDTLITLAMDVWFNQVRPIAVGTMIVAAFYTLYTLRQSLVSGIGRALGDIRAAGGADDDRPRTEIDLDFRKVFVAIGVMAVATFFLYLYFARDVPAALVLTLVMVILGFLFSAVAGYLVGLIGNSNNPISGLTLSALLIAAVLMVVLGVTNVNGVAAVLAVSGVVCCAAGIAGDMMQDLKVGHILGGTPWRMEIGEIIGVVGASLVLATTLMVMHNAYEIGSVNLPAPQAGLMALVAKGIVGGEMAWPLVITGMAFAVGLILVGAPSPMLIAVGMYLPFHSTSAIFVGGVMHHFFRRHLSRSDLDEDGKTKAENTGILLSSGFIAGESLMAVLIAFLYLGSDFFTPLLTWREAVRPPFEASYLAGLIVYPLIMFLLVWFPVRAARAARSERSV